MIKLSKKELGLKENIRKEVYIYILALDKIQLNFDWQLETSNKSG